MSRNLSTRHLVDKHSTLPASLKSRISSPPKKANSKGDSKTANKSSKQQLASTNPKATTSYTSKNKKDTTAESSPLEIPESSQSSYDGLYKGQIQKSLGQKEGSRLTDLCQSDKTKVGELIKKIAEEKEEKESFQQELHRRQMEYEKTIEDLKRNNHELVKSTLEVKDDLKNSMGLMKSVETMSSKQRQNKLFSNLISSKEQRTYDYNNNPLIANKENVFRQATDSTPKSLTSLSGTRLTPTSHHTLPPKDKRFSELDLDLQIAERRDKIFRPAVSDKIVLDQEPEELTSHSYKLQKFQKLQEDKKPSFDKFSVKPETTETLHSVFSPMRTSFYSSKLSQPEERREEEKPLRNPAKTFSSSHNNYLTTASPIESKRKVDLYSPNKSEQYSITLTRETENGKENGQDWRNIMEDKNKYSKGFSSSSSNIMNRGMPPKSPSDSYTMLRDTKTTVRTDNNSPSQSQKRNTERNSSGRYSAEPSDRTKEKRDQEGSNVIPGIVDLGQMNVNQLVELKKIIDERIEIEELKNKSHRVRRSPLRNLQKADKIMKSPENQQFSQKIVIGDDFLDNRSSLRKDSSMDKFRKTDSFINKNSGREERDSLDLKQANSLGVPSQRDYYMKGKYGASAGNFFPLTTAESEGTKRSRDNSSRGKGSQGNISLEKDIEELYNQKLKEFLDVRDTLLKIKESSSEASIHGKSGRESKLSIDANDNNALLSSNILYQFTSPMGTKSPMSMAPLKDEDLFNPPVITQSAPITRTASKTVGFNAGETYGFRDEKLNPQKNFSFANSGASSEKNSGLLNFGRKDDLNGADLMKLVSNMEKNKAIRSEQRPVLETTDKLTKKELDRLINKANTIEDSPERSPDQFSRGDILHQLAQKNKDLAKDFFDPSSPIAKGFMLPEDSLSLLETPTLNPLHYGSRSNSSMIETDLSIMAINNKIDEMREDLYENKLY